MYYITKTIEISAAHRLTLGYESKCRAIHGHNWLLTVHCRAEAPDDSGMVVDFTAVKTMLKERMDHKVLNDVFDFNPTAENIARWVVDNVPRCWRCDVRESEGNVATYIRE